MSTLNENEIQKINEFIGKIIFDVIFNQKSCVKCSHTFTDLAEYNEMALDEIAELIDLERSYQSESIDVTFDECLKVCNNIFPMLSSPDRKVTAKKLLDFLCHLLK